MKVNRSVILQKNKGKISIFDGEKSIFYSLNETASVILSAIKNNKTEEDILKKIISMYKVSPTEAKKDIKDVIRSLKKKKILVK